MKVARFFFVALLLNLFAFGLNPGSPSSTLGSNGESVTIDPSGQTSTVRIRNLSEKAIIAFDLA